MKLDIHTFPSSPLSATKERMKKKLKLHTNVELNFLYIEGQLL